MNRAIVIQIFLELLATGSQLGFLLELYFEAKYIIIKSPNDNVNVDDADDGDHEVDDDDDDDDDDDKVDDGGRW